VQACALTVIDTDGEKIGQLAAQLQEQGYTVQTVSVSATDVAAGAPAPAAAAPAEPVAAAEPVEPDNSLEFKCPQCGRTYSSQVTCANQHPPAETEPTSDVLAAAEAAATTAEEPAPAAAEPAAAAEPPAAPAAGTAAAAETAPETGGAEAAGADPPAPDWPQ
jgi:hypothetical protein